MQAPVLLSAHIGPVLPMRLVGFSPTGMGKTRIVQKFLRAEDMVKAHELGRQFLMLPPECPGTGAFC
jgi:hypothetical protein